MNVVLTLISVRVVPPPPPTPFFACVFVSGRGYSGNSFPSLNGCRVLYDKSLNRICTFNKEPR